MKTRFLLILAMFVACLVSSMTVHADQTPAVDDGKPVMCIGSEQHEVFAGTEDTEVSGGNSLYSCLKMAKAHHNVVAICDLDSMDLSKCLNNNADVLVKHDPNKPKAWNVFRLYVTVDGKQSYVDILTPKTGAISGSFNGVPFNLSVSAQSNNQTQVNYTINGVTGGYRFDQNDWVQAGDTVLQRL
jgi:hypothetical protein